MKPVNLADFEECARKMIPKMAYEYYASGAHDAMTLRDNRDAYDRIRINYRVLRDINQRSLSNTAIKEVLVDSGVRRGADVLKAIAFGAKAVV